MQHPAPGDIHDVNHRAPASVQHGGPAPVVLQLAGVGAGSLKGPQNANPTGNLQPLRYFFFASFRI
jgi:hypothetical protein